MGQKVNPNVFRLPVTADRASIWYTNNTRYADLIEGDFLIRSIINSHYKNPVISRVLIDRSGCIELKQSDNQTLSHEIVISIYSSNPGHIVGRNGKELDALRMKLRKVFGHAKFKIDVVECKRGDSDASLIAQNIAAQIKKRGNYKRIAKKAIESAMRFDDCLGVKITCSGRLGGAEIAKSEIFKMGSIPLHTISANVNYALATSETIYGVIGIKVWVYLDSFNR
jgi:small subunit ribosomal protein S3